MEIGSEIEIRVQDQLFFLVMWLQTYIGEELMLSLESQNYVQAPAHTL